MLLASRFEYQDYIIIYGVWQLHSASHYKGSVLRFGVLTLAYCYLT